MQGEDTPGVQAKSTRPSKRKKNRKIRSCIDGITKGQIKRMARRGGVSRISSLVYDKIRKSILKFIHTLVKAAVTMSGHHRRKTMTLDDVLQALKQQHKAVYGLGD